MPQYLYKATSDSGKVFNGVLEAEGEKEVVAELHHMGFIPIRITRSKSSGNPLNLDISKHVHSFFKGVSSKEIMAFTQDLATLLESGLPVDRALSILIDAAEKEKMKEMVDDILKTVQGGGYLS
ncbi:MAG: type II secretion system F family protein, partial [Deltaproteobacteria bacterium]|nr:type II secretion system F family protein [Deltaproteobacteria bacterium]